MKITIEPAIKSEHKKLAALILETGEPLLEFIFTTRKIAAIDFLEYLVKQPLGQFSHSHIQVAKVNSQLAGLLLCINYDDYTAEHKQMAKFVKEYYALTAIPALAVRAMSANMLVPAPEQGSVYLAHLAVEQTHRRQGIASQLMDVAIQFAKKENANYLILDVEKSNTKAQSLYIKKEFKIDREPLLSKLTSRLGLGGVLRMSLKIA